MHAAICGKFNGGSQYYETPEKPSKERSDSYPKGSVLSGSKQQQGRTCHYPYMGFVSRIGFSLNQLTFAEGDAKSIDSYTTVDSEIGQYRSPTKEDLEYQELQYRKPKKQFKSKEEKLGFIQSYMNKQKTEV